MRPPALSCGSSNRSPGLATGANGISMRSNSSASSASLCLATISATSGRQHRPRPHAVLVGLVGRIGQQIRPREMLAEAAPLAVAGDADKNLLAVGGREGLVDRPGAVARRHRRHRFAGDHLAGHVRHHQKCGGFEQRGFDRLAAAGLLALAQRRLDADHREHAAHDVDHRGAGAQRLARRPGHVSQARHELHHLVERRAMLVGAAEKSLSAQ